MRIEPEVHDRALKRVKFVAMDKSHPRQVLADNQRAADYYRLTFYRLLQASIGPTPRATAHCTDKMFYFEGRAKGKQKGSVKVVIKLCPTYLYGNFLVGTGIS
jgi:hypothetical protein